MTTSRGSSEKRVRAKRPSVAQATSWPASSRVNLRISKAMGSSSTIRIRIQLLFTSLTDRNRLAFHERNGRRQIFETGADFGFERSQRFGGGGGVSGFA